MTEKLTGAESGAIADSDIAIIGISCRVPGAATPEAFWHNLRDGVESISFFEDEDLLSAGIKPALIHQPDYVKAGAVLSDIESFDAFFFDINSREAEMLDPQHRIFLECAWEALERAGYNTRAMNDNAIGLYAGIARSSYLLNNLLPHLQQANGATAYQAFMGNDKDFAPTRVSYKLNLKGPSLSVGTGCSSSLVAVHLACQSLLNGECDMALAGGAAISSPQVRGYLYQEGMIMSPEGHCRAFDAKAQGVMGGRGAGVIVLKRLVDAVADGDSIEAVIKGSAINNDGAFKVGYTAPSVDGQATVIAEALAIAEVDPDTITYIEAHGTGTQLGDPIEVAALTKAFRIQTDKKRFCAIGSVKTNFGHLDTAAGIAGLIKTVLALKHQQIPASLHFETPNPKIDFANSPFYVNSKLSAWQAGETPRRAGVSSFGIGGANAHVVLEETPTEILAEREAGDSPPEKLGQRPYQLLLLSAKTSTALDTATENLAAHLTQRPDLNLADVAYTLQVGRRRFAHRRMVVCSTAAEGAAMLKTLDPQLVLTQRQEAETQPVAFMFSGQGSQYANMGKDLYDCEPVFRKCIDHCAELLQSHLNVDLRSLLYPQPDQIEAARETLKQTCFTQPALFVIEYALAQLWMAWGVKPQAMIGHSIGEYVAACLAGVFCLEDALTLVAHRGRLMQQVSPGLMAAVPLSSQAVEPLLGERLNIAAINGPALTIVSGTIEAVEALQTQLTAKGVDVRPLHTSHGFHSHMMEPILPTFIRLVEKVERRPPQIPYLSNLTGTWITAAQAIDPTYWADHMRQTVRFSDGLQQLFDESAPILLEVGPGRTLSALTRRHPQKHPSQVVLSSLRHPKEAQSDSAFWLNTLGQVWLAGGQIDWSGVYAHERRYRLPLPTYPFERQRYWVEPPTQSDSSSVGVTSTCLGKRSDIADWFYTPAWSRSIKPVSSPSLSSKRDCWLVFVDQCDLGSQLLTRLELDNQDVIAVEAGSEFQEINPGLYTLNPRHRKDYQTLLGRLIDLGKLPNTILHLWSIHRNIQATLDRERFDRAQDVGFYSLIYLAQVLGEQNFADEFKVVVVSNNMQDVTGEESLCPEKATVLGAVKTIPQEYPNIRCQSIDFTLPTSGSQPEKKRVGRLVEQLWSELTATTGNDLAIAYRGNYRWVQTFEPVSWAESTPQLRKKGVYLITGGLGNIGLVLADYLAKTTQAKLILTGRSEFPDRERWEHWLAKPDPQDSVSGKIQALKQLEALGAEVLVISVDVANQEQMQAAISQAEAKFGQIHGVFHGAGIMHTQTLAEIGPPECEAQFQPKVYGLLVLEQILRERRLDFWLLLSSLSSVLGPVLKPSGIDRYAEVSAF